MKRAIVILATALAPAWGLSQIIVGQTAGFTGPVGAGVQETTAGARLWIDHVNAKGGVHGQKIELISMDDKFEPKLAAENARVLIDEKKVLALFLTRGTPHTEAILPMLEPSGVPLVGPSTGAAVLHQPLKRQVFNVRATYQREVEKAISHLHTVGITRIAVVFADDSFGADGLEGANRGFGKAGIKPVATLRADRSKPDYTTIIPEITGKDAQAVVWIASGTAVAEGVKALRAAKSAARVVTLSNNASAGFVKSLGEAANGVIVTQVFPSERSTSFPFVKEATDLAKGKELSPAMLEGFAAAKVLVEGLRRAGNTPTRAKLTAALETLRNYNMGGLELSYGLDDRSGLEFADLSIIGQDGKFKR